MIEKEFLGIHGFFDDRGNKQVVTVPPSTTIG
jgi:hypothetical protein